MPRPPFQLSDDSGRKLVQLLQPILVRHPPNQREHHRPFIREFVRAVHDATGQTYSPTIYRRLLDAYAPDRRPSTTTLAEEKKALEAALALEAGAGVAPPPAGEDGQGFATLVRREIDRVLDALQASARDPDTVSQIEFLQQQLVQAEQIAVDVRRQAAQLAADLQAASQERDLLRSQLGAADALAAQQSDRLEALTKEIADIKRFAMNAIDGVRGETRARADQVASLEAQLKAERRHTEVFRQAAYARGAAIPADLLPGKSS